MKAKFKNATKTFPKQMVPTSMKTIELANAFAMNWNNQFDYISPISNQ